MGSIVQMLEDKGLIKPPRFLATNVHYETMVGSVAYGVESNSSDIDVYGIAIPPKDVVFPHLRGIIAGFGHQGERFDQFQEHHVESAKKNVSYDLSIYSIIKFFNLAMQNNPNIIDALFTPQFCILHITKVGQMIREQRKMFLHKGSWHKFKGYAYSQLHKMTTKNPQGKRKEAREKYGYDVKFAYHVVRLLDEAEQILEHGDIDLQRNRAQLKAIRCGEMEYTEVIHWAAAKELQLEDLYHKSTLQHGPDEDAIKALLLQCLEEHFGNLDACVVQPDRATVAINKIRDIVSEF